MKQLARVVAAIVLIIGTVLGGGPATASPNCETDVALTMAATVVTSAPAYQVQYQIDVVNSGPCNPPGVTVFDDLSLLTPGWTAALTATTPTSWSCTFGSTSFTCDLPGAKLGIADDKYAALTLVVTWPSAPASTTNKAIVSTPYPDPNLIDNTAYGAIVDATNSLATEPLTNGKSQQQKISSLGQSLGAQVRFGSACDSGIDAFSVSCFGNIVRIDIDGTIDAYMVLTFLYTADAVPPGTPLSQLGILHRISCTGANTPVIGDCQSEGQLITYSLEPCPNQGPIPAWGCIAKKERLSDAALMTPANPKGYYYVFTVFTPNNNDWAGDS